MQPGRSLISVHVVCTYMQRHAQTHIWNNTHRVIKHNTIIGANLQPSWTSCPTAITAAESEEKSAYREDGRVHCYYAQTPYCSISSSNLNWYCIVDCCSLSKSARNRQISQKPFSGCLIMEMVIFYFYLLGLSRGIRKEGVLVLSV